MATSILNKCPKCGSDEISKPRMHAAAVAISILTFGFPIFPFMSMECLCYDCGHKFKVKE